ncbi:FliM/FliN family flagellar motor C-terminal domain-containing protein [Pseudoduganella chitinolytica]|uniref:FliM/FliN family flagellar motor C-terminal domain-containing protein n=1 Tax=Pseudoduganella chitinolytica TaxID=34070 RepID=A0ABY8BD11_9BURK|nr:FliM/FliN family flagellar motor C-terminal domain-containing protein [Pseudoduganella chitinolytica]WEF32856.1 FliM/FliN family flagellar motor C-terminal domain-containing protein [Pseudoduganella chitinolytica]
MSVRPYALLGAAVLAAVRAQCESAVATWCRDWGVDASAFVVTCHRAWEQSAAPAWRGSLQSGAESMWLGWDNELRGSLQRLLFPPDRQVGPHTGAATLAAAAASAALDALAAVLGRALLDNEVPFAGDAADVPAAMRQHGSGAVLAEIRLDRHACWCLLGHDSVLRLGGARPAAAAPLAALDYPALLGDQPVRLAVAAGQASVGLGSLLSLAPGDVIRLDTLADQPLAVAGPDGAVLLRGYLGTSERQLALDIVAGDQSSGVKHDL